MGFGSEVSFYFISSIFLFLLFWEGWKCLSSIFSRFRIVVISSVSFSFLRIESVVFFSVIFVCGREAFFFRVFSISGSGLGLKWFMSFCCTKYL